MPDNLKNVVLDLGGVLYDIDPERTIAGLKDLLLPEAANSISEESITEMVHAMETGRWTDEFFITKVKESCKPGVTEEDILKAWNMILINFPEHRVDMVKSLSEKYRLFLLSNTNDIHIRHFEALFLDKYGFPLPDLFEKIYYSSVIGMRKPDINAFLHVLDDSGLKASETVMVDDRRDNCEGAQSAGMKFILVPENTGLEKVIGQLLN